MEALVKEGLVRNIGVSNVATGKIMDILKYAKIKPAIVQNEIHPHLAQEKLIRFSRKCGVQVMAYSSFGDLSTAGGKNTFLHKDELTVPAKKYNKTPGQVALRWAIQRGTVVMPKTEKVERLVENFTIFDFQLTQEEMDKITSLNKNERYLDPGVFSEMKYNSFVPIYD